MITRMKILRTQFWLVSRSQVVSGFCTTPMSRPAITSRTYSGRCGGNAARPAAAWVSAMGDGLLFLDAVRKQHVVDAVGQLLAAGGVNRIVAVAVELALHLSGMGRHQQNAVADQHGFGNGMGDEQHG